MLAKEDLMIGDCVLYRDNDHEEVVKIEELTEFGFNPSYSYGEIVNSYHYGYAFPIQLTKEILEKNGFKAELGLGGLFTLEVSGVNCEIYFNVIRYVHELQHALKLCGITLNIVL